jgi:hypothetical protein
MQKEELPPGYIFKDEWSAATGGDPEDLEIDANRRYALNHPRRAFKTLQRWNDGPWIREPSNAAKANPMDFALKWSASKFVGHLDPPMCPMQRRRFSSIATLLWQPAQHPSSSIRVRPSDME